MLQLEALSECLEEQLDLRRLRAEPCACHPEASEGTGCPDATSASSSAHCARKVEALETFISELQDTNRHLVETLTELEHEARNRVRTMEQVLERTAHSAKSYMVELSEYEQTTRTALKDKLKYLSVIKKLGDQVSRLERDKADAQDHCGNLAHDIASLVRLISHARNTGRWDVGNIDFCEVTCEQVFGSIDKLDSWPGDLDLLDNPAFDPESPTRDHRNAAFKSMSIPDRAPSVFSQSSVRTIGASSGGHVTKRDAELYRLQVEMRHAHKQLTGLQSELSHRDRTIAELQVQIVDLNHQISLKDNECFVHHRHQQELTSERQSANFLSVTASPNAVSVASEVTQIHSSAFTSFQRDNKGDQVDHPLSTATSQATSDSGLDMLGVPQRRLHELVSQLTRDCHQLTERLTQREEELSEARERSIRLEGELGDVERVWQELDACKEDNELVLTKLDSKRRQVRELRATLRQQEEVRRPSFKEVATLATQTEVDSVTPCGAPDAELERLTVLEQRHRLKASGLEMVVGQLQDRLAAEASRLQVLSDENYQLRRADTGIVVETPTSTSEQLIELEETVTGLRQELSVILDVVDHKNREIENQKLTIRNLQEAVVLMKRTSPAANVTVPATYTTANGSSDPAPTTNGSDPAPALSKLSSRSRDILHI